MSAPARPDRRPGEVTFRRVMPAELSECAAIWRESINDYTRRQGRLEIPLETGPLLRLYSHLQATDPDGFVAALAPASADGGGEQMLGFGAAVRRERLWFLSMLFVLPAAQGQGLGRALLARIMPVRSDGEGAPDDVVHSTATDSAQPISNALYATYGIVPRAPLLNLIGLPERRDAFGRLPPGVAPVPLERVEGEAGGIDRLATVIEGLDREVLSVAHPMDHAFVRAEGRRGFLYTGPDGSALGYGYAGESGRVGPIATRDPDLMGPILGHLTEAIQPRGAFAVWLAGDADRAVASALRAGFRLDDYPVLLCWDRPFVDLARYVPISPGLP